MHTELEDPSKKIWYKYVYRYTPNIKGLLNIKILTWKKGKKIWSQSKK